MGEAEAEDVEYLGLLPELMTDDEHGAGGIVQRALSKGRAAGVDERERGGHDPSLPYVLTFIDR